MFFPLDWQKIDFYWTFETSKSLSCFFFYYPFDERRRSLSVSVSFVCVCVFLFSVAFRSLLFRSHCRRKEAIWHTFFTLHFIFLSFNIFNSEFFGKLSQSKIVNSNMCDHRCLSHSHALQKSNKWLDFGCWFRHKCERVWVCVLCVWLCVCVLILINVNEINERCEWMCVCVFVCLQEWWIKMVNK